MFLKIDLLKIFGDRVAKVSFSRYQHLCERDAYERKLKGFIENEVTALHEYNKELENVCRVRRSCAPCGPPSFSSFFHEAAKGGQGGT